MFGFDTVRRALLSRADPFLPSLRSWLSDALIVVLASATGIVAALVMFQALTMNMFQPDQALWIWALLSALGTPLGLVGGSFAYMAWSASPSAARWAGPGVGAALGCVLYALVTWADDPSRGLDDEPWLWVALAGAAAVGPPWLAYCAVLARGRSPRWVALASGPWTTTALLVMLVGLYGISLFLGDSFGR
jgi:hypothetical protein